MTLLHILTLLYTHTNTPPSPSHPPSLNQPFNLVFTLFFTSEPHVMIWSHFFSCTFCCPRIKKPSPFLPSFLCTYYWYIFQIWQRYNSSFSTPSDTAENSSIWFLFQETFFPELSIPLLQSGYSLNWLYKFHPGTSLSCHFRNCPQLFFFFF